MPQQGNCSKLLPALLLHTASSTDSGAQRSTADVPLRKSYFAAEALHSRESCRVHEACSSSFSGDWEAKQLPCSSTLQLAAQGTGRDGASILLLRKAHLASCT